MSRECGQPALSLREGTIQPPGAGNSAPHGKAKGHGVSVHWGLATSLVSYFTAFQKFPPGCEHRGGFVVKRGRRCFSVS